MQTSWRITLRTLAAAAALAVGVPIAASAQTTNATTNEVIRNSAASIGVFFPSLGKQAVGMEFTVGAPVRTPILPQVSVGIPFTTNGGYAVTVEARDRFGALGATSIGAGLGFGQLNVGKSDGGVWDVFARERLGGKLFVTEKYWGGLGRDIGENLYVGIGTEL